VSNSEKQLVKNFKLIEKRYPNLGTPQDYSEENVKQIVHEDLQELKQKDLKKNQS